MDRTTGGQTEGRTDGRKDEQTNGQTEPTKTIYPFGILCMPGYNKEVPVYMKAVKA